MEIEKNEKFEMNWEFADKLKIRRKSFKTLENNISKWKIFLIEEMKNWNMKISNLKKIEKIENWKFEKITYFKKDNNLRNSKLENFGKNSKFGKWERILKIFKNCSNDFQV